MTPPRLGRLHGFTLVEMLVVIAIISVLTSLCVPAIKGIFGSGQTNVAIAQLTGTYELARSQSLSNHTYVRVGLTNLLPSQTGTGASAVAVVVIASTDGTLANDTAAAMADNSKWAFVGKPLVFNNLWNYDTLGSSPAAVLANTAPDTSGDAKPSDSNVASFSRTVGSLGPQFFPGSQGGGIVQFGPDGEARVLEAQAARYIRIGLDQPIQPANPSAGFRDRDPFLLRVSAINGSIAILRKEVLN